jgi:hypothetical protein
VLCIWLRIRVELQLYESKSCVGLRLGSVYRARVLNTRESVATYRGRGAKLRIAFVSSLMCLVAGIGAL